MFTKYTVVTKYTILALHKISPKGVGSWKAFCAKDNSAQKVGWLGKKSACDSGGTLGFPHSGFDFFGALPGNILCRLSRSLSSRHFLASIYEFGNRPTTTRTVFGGSVAGGSHGFKKLRLAEILLSFKTSVRASSAGRRGFGGIDTIGPLVSTQIPSGICCSVVPCTCCIPKTFQPALSSSPPIIWHTLFGSVSGNVWKKTSVPAYGRSCSIYSFSRAISNFLGKESLVASSRSHCSLNAANPAWLLLVLR